MKRDNGELLLAQYLRVLKYSCSLIRMEAEEAAIVAKEEQRNILEGYLYKLRDLLDSESQHTFGS